MLEGPTENPIAVKDLPPITPVVENKPQPPNAAQEMKNNMAVAASGLSGGATEQGLKQEMYKIQLARFLKEKVGFNLQQFNEFPEELKRALNEFNPKNEAELNAQFADILQKLSVAGSLTKEQQESLTQLRKAIVEEGTLKAETVFAALQKQVKEATGIPPDEKIQAVAELTELQEDLKNPSEVLKKKSFKETIQKVSRIVGISGLVMFLLSLWRAFKETMGFQSQG